jgi:hypothetical protein
LGVGVVRHIVVDAFSRQCVGMGREYG